MKFSTKTPINRKDEEEYEDSFETPNIPDSVSQYLRNMAKKPMISPKREIELAKRIKLGDEDARTEMIEANLRFVVSIAKEYKNHGLDLLDIINEGNIGLMESIKRFQPKKGAKLSTYAGWWIKQCIRLALKNKGHLIRLPTHISDAIARMRRAENELNSRLNDTPTVEEIAQEMGVTPERIRFLQRVWMTPDSLDREIMENNGNTLHDLVADEHVHDLSRAIDSELEADYVMKLVNQLEPRERQIIKMRFGLDGCNWSTLEEIGDMFGISRERVRQLEEKALKRMRGFIQQSELQRKYNPQKAFLQ